MGFFPLIFPVAVTPPYIPGGFEKVFEGIPLVVEVVGTAVE